MVQKAAEQRHADAQAALGRCYESGEGVALDIKLADSWYCKAAIQGNAVANVAIERLQNARKAIRNAGFH